jgi:putative transposase
MSLSGLKKNLMKYSNVNDRKACVKRENRNITVKRQTELLEINRTSVYRRPVQRVINDQDLRIMRWIDEIHTNEPTWGYRTITRILKRDYHLKINRKKVRRMMRDMGIYVLYPKPNLSKRYHAQYVRPYLLRNLEITRPNQVWGIDITYIPMAKGFMYLFVIIDWYSRYIVDYELSSTIDKAFVLNCLKRALALQKPEIINSDQGSHFTNADYIKLLEDNNVKISMDGKGQCLDNARTERFFRSLKYERVYVYEYQTPRDLRIMLNDYMKIYNTYRPHSLLEDKTPFQAYFGNQLFGAISYQETRKGA